MMRTKIAAPVLIVTALLDPSLARARATEPSFNNNCGDDAKRLCPGKRNGKLLACLMLHLGETASLCQEMMVDDKVCRREIERFCGDVPLGRGRIIYCLRSHRSRLSPGCRSYVSDYFGRQ